MKIRVFFSAFLMEKNTLSLYQIYLLCGNPCPFARKRNPHFYSRRQILRAEISGIRAIRNLL